MNPQLLPATARDVPSLTTTAYRIAELDGFDAPPPEDEAAFNARVAQIIADHVEPARSRAYHELGDGRRAVVLAVRWLRPKLVAKT